MQILNVNLHVFLPFTDANRIAYSIIGLNSFIKPVCISQFYFLNFAFRVNRVLFLIAILWRFTTTAYSAQTSCYISPWGEKIFCARACLIKNYNEQCVLRGG